jgi:polyhydroxyalkanoate synthesis regulator phasin
MNSDTLTQLLHRSLRVTLGATASLIEILQDPQRRQENLSRLSTDLQQLTEEWAAKGEVTEREARTFVDSMLSRQSASVSDRSATSTVSRPTTITTTASPASDPRVQADLRELTTQIAAMRAEIERLKQQDSNS